MEEKELNCYIKERLKDKDIKFLEFFLVLLLSDTSYTELCEKTSVKKELTN